ncbi:ribonuclease inhibitor [soil metagenome]
MLLSITEFFGHLHPLLVHLPIGILLIGLLLQFLARKKRYYILQPAVPIILLAGAISGLFSCITGYLLSISDDYDKSVVSWHMWMGIATTMAALILYAKEKNDQFKVNKTVLSIGLLLLIAITGHLGGSLTHGSDYLSKPLKNIFSDDTAATAAIKPIANVQEAKAYDDIIQPILETKCYSCHGPNKQKGKLRMDVTDALMKGGEDGKIIEAGNADESELIKRLLLPTDNDDHMPPKEKSQLSEKQIALLHWWINSGPAFDKQVKDLPQDAQIKPLLLALQNVSAEIKQAASLPKEPVVAADATVMKQLKEKGVLVLPVSLNSNYLAINFMNDSTVDAGELQLIAQLNKQLVSLKLSGTNAGDETLKVITQCTNLIKLFLDGTEITDKGLSHLKSFQNLTYLNLVDTKISAQGLLQLKDMQKLQSIYFYKTSIGKADWPALHNAFPKAELDSGGYIVPILASDTTEVKVKKAY